jgi:hypothetical protein
MKKIIIGVCAVVIILSAGMAKAISITPEDLYGPLEPVWRAIDNLQKQIKDIRLTPGPQGEVGPIGPQGPQGEPGDTVNIIDANNINLGPLLDFTLDGNIKFYDTNYDRVVNLNMFTEGLVEKYDGPDINHALYYDQLNCQGNTYRQQRVFPKEILRINSPEYTQYGWEYITSDSLEIFSGSIMASKWEHDQCSAVNPSPEPYYSKVVQTEPMIFNGPFTIED